MRRRIKHGSCSQEIQSVTFLNNFPSWFSATHHFLLISHTPEDLILLFSYLHLTIQLHPVSFPPLKVMTLEEEITY